MNTDALRIYEQRRITKLIHFRHRSFWRLAAPTLLDIIYERYESQGRKLASGKNPPWQCLKESISLGIRNLFVFVVPPHS